MISIKGGTIRWMASFLSIAFSVMSFSYGQSQSSYRGFSAEFLTGEMWVLGHNGRHYSLKFNIWETPSSSHGVDFSYAPSLSGDPKMNIYRAHIYKGWYMRRLGRLYPYIVGSYGFHLLPDWREIEGWPDPLLNYYRPGRFTASWTVRVGASLELGRMRLSLEQGGGNMGTGHIENNLSLAYAFRPLPIAEIFKGYNATVGVQSFTALTGKYRGGEGGYDLNLQIEKEGQTINYNVGFFITDYLLNTGVFHAGKGWKMDTGSRLFDYLDVMPGYQILLWAEPQPDFILPAASLDLRVKLRIWRFLIYARTRTIATFSPGGAGLVTGTLIALGIGLTG